MGGGVGLRECVVHPMNFFRVVGVFRCKKIPLPPSFTDLLHPFLFSSLHAPPSNIACLLGCTKKGSGKCHFLGVALIPQLHWAAGESLFLSLLLVDDDAITIDCALDGDAKEGLVPNLILVGTSGGTQGATASQGDEQHGGNRNKKNFFHRVFSFFGLQPFRCPGALENLEKYTTAYGVFWAMPNRVLNSCTCIALH